MIAQVSLINIGVVSSCYVAVIGVIYWTSRTKVNNKTFDLELERIEKVEQKSEGNQLAIVEIKTDIKYIKEAVARIEEKIDDRR